MSRRTLIHFKLFKSQTAILFAAVIFTLVLGWSRTAGPIWTRAVGWWLILSTLNLHLLGSSFARTILLDRGISNWKRRIGVLALVAAVAGGVAIWAWQTLPAPPPAESVTGLEDIQYYVERVLGSGPMVYLLFPFRLVVSPYLAMNARDFLIALGPALLLLGLHYLWVVRSNVAFEEASVEASRKMAEKVAAVRAGKHPLSGPKKRKRAPFKLGPTGLPAVALLWKNLIGAGSIFTLRFWIFLIWMAVVVGIVTGTNIKTANFAVIVGPLVLMFLAMSFLMGPQFVRQDFRQELPMADMLKTYPVPAWQLALGELLAPVVILTALQWCLIVLAVFMLPRFGSEEFSLAYRLAAGFSAAVMAPVLNMVSLLIPNSAVLLFPGWFQTGREAPHGIEAMGQRMVFMIGQLIVLGVALVPVIVVFAVVLVVVQMAGHPVMAIPLAAVAAALIMALEAALGLMLLGRLFERFDVSGEAVPG
ncbi:MAG: putative transporter, permease protein [Pedosphaera sp.]|nr:putative transporter, permease protein [Pedosphaera sp.]